MNEALIERCVDCGLIHAVYPGAPRPKDSDRCHCTETLGCAVCDRDIDECECCAICRNGPEHCTCPDDAI